MSAWYALKLTVEYGGYDTNRRLASSQDIDKLKAFAQDHSSKLTDRQLAWRESSGGGLYANGAGGSGGYYQYRIVPIEEEVVLE